jgi:NAD+ synthase (glutamine-hydrolysing)
VRIGLAQIDTRIGDFEENARRILAAVEAARRQGAELVVFPELVVTGYPPRDLLLDPAFVERALAATQEIARETAAGPPVVLGCLARSGRANPGHPGLLGAAAWLEGGRLRGLAAKRLLPSYDVFHETRWFVPGDASTPFDLGGQSLGLLVCEDLWDEGYALHPPADLAAAGAEVLVCVASSPYRAGVREKRLHHGRRAGRPLVYVNAAGANDELIFDGGSFVLDAEGRLMAELPRFREAVEVVEVPGSGARSPSLGREEELFRALALGIRDFVAKNALGRVFLGLSGGVDSALVACIAAEAVGPGAVTALALPSRHSDPRSTTSARELAAALGVALEVLDIEPLCQAARAALAPLLDESPEAAVADENLQARLRALVLSAHVNRRGGLLLNTSNKTELSLGYGTLYGDLAGTLSVIGDLTKPQVYAVARWYARERGTIPAFILERPPSAELRPGQVDPFDYPVVAPLLESLVLGSPSPASADLDAWKGRLRSSEHKRFQHGIVLKVSERAFGTGRMVPVTRAP